MATRMPQHPASLSRGGVISSFFTVGVILIGLGVLWLSILGVRALFGGDLLDWWFSASSPMFLVAMGSLMAVPSLVAFHLGIRYKIIKRGELDQ